MTPKENKYSKKERITIIILFILVIIALMNPHFEKEKGDMYKTINIEDSHTISSDFWGYDNTDIYSFKFDCTKGVTIENDFSALCNSSDQYGCATRPLWTLKGKGVCIVSYAQEYNALRWF